jgi:hypothetical protein
VNTAQFWKNELNREEIQLGRLLESDGPEKLVTGSVAVERFAFLTAYIMRMLAEADEPSEEVIKSKWPVRPYPCVRMPPHRHWFMVYEAGGKNPRQPLEDHYDLQRPTEHPPFTRTHTRCGPRRVQGAVCKFSVACVPPGAKRPGTTSGLGRDSGRKGIIASHVHSLARPRRNPPVNRTPPPENPPVWRNEPSVIRRI